MPGAQVWVLDIVERLGKTAWSNAESRWLAAGWLKASELEAASVLQHALHRRQHLAGRVLARTRLALYLKVCPSRIDFCAAGSGKPLALLDGAAAAVQFNISHSGHRVALAFADCEVGIDIETRSHRVDAVALSRRFFATSEARWIEGGGRRAADRFGALWSLKEAVLKARGVGISGGLKDFTFRRTGFRSLSTRAVNVDSPQAAWHCQLRAWPGYWAAVCTLRPSPAVSWRQITIEDL